MYLIDLFFKHSSVFYKYLQFEVIVLFIVIIGCMTLLFPKNYSHVIILIFFSVMVLELYTLTTLKTSDEFNETTFSKLNRIEKTMMIINKKATKEDFDYLYMDANLIYLLDSILWIVKYNPLEFYLLVKGSNNILKILYDIESFYNANGVYPENIAELYDIALDIRTKTINNMHNLIYSLPQKEFKEFTNNISNRYIILITRDLNKILTHLIKHNKQTGINIRTKIPYLFTSSYDPTPSSFQQFY